MSHEISRMFATAEHAHSAAAELREDGFDEIYVVSPPAKADTPLSAIAAQIAQGNVLLADAKVYAARVAQGGTLVTVHAPFGTGMLATNILESHDPVASGMPDPAPVKLWDEAAPLSSALMMPLIIDDATPASTVIGLRPLTNSDCSFSGAIGLPLLSDNAAPLSTGLGMGTLSNNPAPLSSLLGLPLLRESRRRSA